MGSVYCHVLGKHTAEGEAQCLGQSILPQHAVGAIGACCALMFSKSCNSACVTWLHLAAKHGLTKCSCIMRWNIFQGVF